MSAGDSTTRVLALGVEAEPLLREEVDVVAFVDVPDSADELLEALRGALESCDGVLVIVPDWFPPVGATRLGVARSLLDTPSVAVYETSLPPLAAAALCSLAAALASRLGSAGMLAAALPAVEERLHAFTWLGSASGLTDPAPTVLQHAASMLPGAAFGVSSWPEPSVHRLTRRSASVPMPKPEEGYGLAVASRAGDVGWIDEVVLPALGDPPAIELDPTPHGPAWWGTARLVESVLYPLDPDALAGELRRRIDPWPCRWCGQEIGALPCPFCAGDEDRPHPRPAPESEEAAEAGEPLPVERADGRTGEG